MALESRQMDLKGKTAVVTGGNSGIGLATATALAQAGSRIVVGSRDQKRNLAVSAKLARKYDVQALAVETDVSREAGKSNSRKLRPNERAKPRNLSGKRKPLRLENRSRGSILSNRLK